MNEYRVVFQYNKDHWSTVYHSSNPEDVYKYIEEHEKEIMDAIEHPDQCIYIAQYYGQYLVAKWKGDDVNELALSFQFIAYPWMVAYLGLGR